MNQDLVVVSYSGDIELLNVFIKSVDKFVPQGLFENFHIILTDDTDSNEIPSIYSSVYKWNIIYAKDMFDLHINGHLSGYFNQQLAKLKISERIKSDWYWVFDSKNFLLRTISEKDLYRKGQKKVLVGIDDPTEFWLSGYLKSLNYFKTDYKQPLVNTTPFPIHTETVKKMINSVENFNNNFFKLCERYSVCEFYFYSAYLVKENLLDELYSKHGCTKITLWPMELDTPEFQPERIRKLLENPHNEENFIWCGGLHKNTIASMSSTQKERWADFLLWIGFFKKKIEVYRWFEKNIYRAKNDPRYT